MAILGHTIGAEIQKILGLEDHHIRKFVITLEVDSIATVDVERFIKEEETGRIIELFERYELGKKQGEPVDISTFKTENYNEYGQK